MKTIVTSFESNTYNDGEKTGNEITGLFEEEDVNPSLEFRLVVPLNDTIRLSTYWKQ